MAKSRRKTSTERDLIRIATFILFDAAVFHDSLTGALPGLRPLRTARPPYSVFLTNEWNRILRDNYTPVFQIARDVLDSFPSSPKTEGILKAIIDAALNVVSSGILLKHDFMGRVYHKLLLRTTGDYYATFYTSLPSAALLANLAFKTDNPAWNFDFGEITSLEDFRVVDCACGSGTLLSASYMALKDRYILAGPVPLQLGRLHRILVEQVLHGWDVLDYAAHLTLTTLALHSTKTTIRTSGVFVVPAGVSADGAVHLGSLDRLQTQMAFVGRGFSKAVRRKSLDETRNEAIPEQRHDVVIMNPPFSRSANPNIKFGYSGPEARTKMSRELKKLGEGLSAFGYDASAIGNAGLSAYFMFLAARLVKHGGRVAAVLPRSMLSGVAFGKVREAFLREFHLEYVVSNYDPGDHSNGIAPWSFSENTTIGEVLVLARRRTEVSNEERTCYVGLWRKPRNEVVALLHSQQIIKKRGALVGTLPEGAYETLEDDGVTVGVLYDVSQESLAVNWLVPAVFAAPELNRMTLGLRLRREGFVPMASVAAEYGYDIRWLKDAFAQVGGPTAHRVVWGHQGAMNTVGLAATHVGYGRPKHGQKSLDIFLRYSSDLLVAERPHLSTECSLCFRTGEPVMGTAFWELRLVEDRFKPVVALWLNSTFGIMQYLSMATSSYGDIFKLKKDQLRGVLVPNPQHLDVAAWERFYATVAAEPLLVYGQEFRRAAEGVGVRLAIDRFVASQLGLELPGKTIYELLAVDPVVTKNRL